MFCNMVGDDQQPTFNTDTTGKPSLECPDCGEPWLHQSGVEVYVRHSEDDERGHGVSVDYSGDVTVSEDASSGNPSGRRDGIKIQFECEQCDGAGEPSNELVVAQHKGNEFVYWQEIEE